MVSPVVFWQVLLAQAASEQATTLGGPSCYYRSHHVCQSYNDGDTFVSSSNVDERAGCLLNAHGPGGARLDSD